MSAGPTTRLSSLYRGNRSNPRRRAPLRESIMPGSSSRHRRTRRYLRSCEATLTPAVSWRRRKRRPTQAATMSREINGITQDRSTLFTPANRASQRCAAFSRPRLIPRGPRYAGKTPSSESLITVFSLPPLKLMDSDIRGEIFVDFADFEREIWGRKRNV